MDARACTVRLLEELAQIERQPRQIVIVRVAIEVFAERRGAHPVFGRLEDQFGRGRGAFVDTDDHRRLPYTNVVDSPNDAVMFGRAPRSHQSRSYGWSY